MRRGELWWADLPAPIKPRPVLLLSRDAGIAVRSQVIVAVVTRRVRGIPSEVSVGPQDGLAVPCVVNCDVLRTIPKSSLRRRLGALAGPRLRAAELALRFALGLD